MNGRGRFKIGLSLITLGVWVIAWITWCRLPEGEHATYSWTSGWERAWKEQLATHDLVAFAFSALATTLFCLGVFWCVDACVWRRAGER